MTLDPARAARVRVLVLGGYGLNCEAETATAFSLAGASAEVVHAAEVLERGWDLLQRFHVLAFVGGFSFGDHVASGRVLANRIRYRIGDDLARFVAEGRLVLGICNGFQTLVKLGLLPGLEAPARGLPGQSVSLVENDRLGYWDTWVRLSIDPESPCVFTRGLSTLECPSRHGEGKLIVADDAVGAALERDHLVVLRYADRAGRPTMTWPDNPSGSPGAIAGLCDRTGRVFGLMPHPEAHLYVENHPDWIQARRVGATRADDRHGAGLAIFENGVRAALDAT